MNDRDANEGDEMMATATKSTAKTCECPKCGGTGFIPAFIGIADGVCFRCEGNGVVKFIKARKPATTVSVERKQNFEAGKWSLAPVAGQVAIFGGMVGSKAIMDWKTGTMSPFAPGVKSYGNEFHGMTVQEACDRYNAGERWL